MKADTELEKRDQTVPEQFDLASTGDLWSKNETFDLKNLYLPNHVTRFC